MLNEILNRELSTLEIDENQLNFLEEDMAGGVGCRGAACAGSCSNLTTK